jgi:hypothetical protein
MFDFALLRLVYSRLLVGIFAPFYLCSTVYICSNATISLFLIFDLYFFAFNLSFLNIDRAVTQIPMDF